MRPRRHGAFVRVKRRWPQTDGRSRDAHFSLFGSKDPVVTCPVTIVSYDLMAKLAYEFRSCNFQVVIADESHYLKNGESKRSMAMVGIMRQAKRAIMLTGTPALARPIELFNLLNCLDPTLFPNYLEYAKRYCAAHQGPFGLDCSGSSNLEELHLVLQERGNTTLSTRNACPAVTLHPLRTGTRLPTAKAR